MRFDLNMRIKPSLQEDVHSLIRPSCIGTTFRRRHISVIARFSITVIL